MTETTKVLRPANESKDLASNYRPVALKAVIAAAMMMKKPAQDSKADKGCKAA